MLHKGDDVVKDKESHSIVLKKIIATAILIVATTSLGHSNADLQDFDENITSNAGNSEEIVPNDGDYANYAGYMSNAPELDFSNAISPPEAGLPGPWGAWVWQNPLPQGNALAALDAVGDRIWTAGYTEAVYRSFDRGTKWNAADVDVYQTIVDLVFADEQNGWIVANTDIQGRILPTKDGGETWGDPIAFDTDGINSLYFDKDNARLWVGGCDGFVAYSDDYGENFVDASIPIDPDYNTNVVQLVFIDQDVGFALTTNRLYYTKDAGQNWEAIYDWGSDVNLYAMAAQPGAMTQAQMICVVGQDGFAQMSENGLDWVDIDIDTTANLNTVALHGAQAFIAGTDGTAFRTELVTSNKWEQAAIPTSATLFKAIFHGIDDVLVSGDWGILMLSEDGGVTWTRLGSGPTLKLNDIAIRDAETGWAVGEGGCILHTSDGETWTEQSSGTTRELHSVCFVSYLRGWAVGEMGCILTTTDGGNTWRRQRSHTLRNLYGVSFVDRDSGWAVGSDGTIIHTSDGGVSWKDQSSPVKSHLYAVSFVDDHNGWAVGEDGAVLSTTDGGRTWNAITITGGNFQDVHFVDSKYGWICGTTSLLLDGNVAYRTENGGATWIREVIPIDASFKVDFVDRSHGWQVGMFAHVIATDDGGRTWRPMPDASPDCWLKSIDMVDQKTGYVAGECGAILRTDTGGDVPV